MLMKLDDKTIFVVLKLSKSLVGILYLHNVTALVQLDAGLALGACAFVSDWFGAF